MYRLVKSLLNEGHKFSDPPKDLQEKVIENALKDPYNCLLWTRTLLEHNKEIPKEIIQSIAKSPGWSFAFSRTLKFDESKIPPEIQESAKKKFEKQGSLSVRSKWLI